MAEIEGLQDNYEPLEVGTMVIPAGASDKEIEKHFEIGRLRVLQEKNDIFLSHVLDFIQGTSESRVWSNLRIASLALIERVRRFCGQVWRRYPIGGNERDENARFKG